MFNDDAVGFVLEDPGGFAVTFLSALVVVEAESAGYSSQKSYSSAISS